MFKETNKSFIVLVKETVFVQCCTIIIVRQSTIVLVKLQHLVVSLVGVIGGADTARGGPVWSCALVMISVSGRDGLLLLGGTC